MRDYFSFSLVLLLCGLSAANSQWIQSDSMAGKMTYCLAGGEATVLAGTQFVAYVSNDTGATWERLETYNSSVMSLARIGSTTLWGSYSSGIYRTTDDGAEWISNAGNGWYTTSVLLVKEQKLFAGTTANAGINTGGGVFLSTDVGVTWKQANSGLGNLNIRCLVSNQRDIYAGTDGGVFVTTDDGNAWTAANNGMSLITVKALVLSGATIFAGTTVGVYVSTNSGVTWAPMNNGLTNTDVRGLATRNEILYAGTGAGVFQSSNGGASWAAMNEGLTNKNVTCLKASGSYLLAGTSSGLFRYALKTESVMRLLNPRYGIGGLAGPLNFYWNRNSKALSYAFQLSTEPNFFMPTVSQNMGDTIITVASLQPNTVYYWRVRAENPTWASDWGVSVFTTRLTISPQMVSPSPGSVVSTTPALQWSPLVTSATYTVQVSTSALFTDLEFSKDTSGTAVLLPKLQNGTSYYWRVHAQTFGDTSAWSSVYTFTTQLKGTTLVYPDSANQNVYLNDWLTWKSDPLARTYHVDISQSPLFSQIYDSASVSGTGYRSSTKSFIGGSTYYWRVRGISLGGNGEFSIVWSFKAGNLVRKPAVSVVPRAIDFGVIKVGVGAERSVSVGNTGNDTLKVLSITVSSLNLKAIQGPTLVVPRGAGELILRFSPSSDGVFIGWVLVNTNAQSYPDTIKVSGTGLATALKTNGTVDFGKIAPGTSRDTVLSLFNTGNDTLVVNDITIFGSAFTLRTFVPMVLPGKSAMDTVRFLAANSGPFSGYAVIKSNSPSSPDTVRLLGFGVTYSLKLSVNRLDFGLVLVGKFKDTCITVSNLGNDTLKVFSITSSIPGLTARPMSFSISPNAATSDTIRFTPLAIGPLVGALVIRSNAPTSPDTVKIAASGVTATTGIAQDGIPSSFELKDNYPNPFNPSTRISYSLPKEVMVSLRIFSAIGQEVAVLVNRREEPGHYQVNWNANVPSGIYFYRLQAGEFVETKKMILLR